VERVRRVAIYQADWAVTVNIVNLLKMLDRNGYESHLFLYRVPANFFALDEIRALGNVTVHHRWDRRREPARIWGERPGAERPPSPGALPRLLSAAADVSTRILRNLRDLVLWPLGTEDGIIPRRVRRLTRDALRGKPCCCHIGVEKKGLIWAGVIGAVRKEPVLYYSLELYTWDYPGYHRFVSARRIKRLEEKYHRRAVATIIQDRQRARHLLHDNGVREGHVIPIPVSLLGNPVDRRSSFVQERFRLDKDDVVIVQLGQISRRRFGPELVDVARQFPPRWKLLLHGWATADARKDLVQEEEAGRVLLSLEPLPWDGLYDLLSSCHIGLVLYKDHCANDRLTVFSSEKLALYLRCGLPVITFDYPGYDMIEREGCGRCITDLDELPGAVSSILEDPLTYRRQAHRCFEKHYEYSRYFAALADFMEALQKGDARTGEPLREGGSP